jgi:hypothetical protein
MKNTSHLLLLLALLAPVSAFAADEPAKPAAPEPTTMIVDLRASQAGIFQYGSWNGKLVPAKSGMAVMGSKGAQGDGGFGQNIPDRIDLSQAEFLEVALGVVPGNEVPRVTIAVNDIDGTQFSAQISISQIVPGQPVWLRAHRNDFKLNNTERGADSLMDWTKIGQWHLQGDWTTKKPLSVIFIALRERR